MVRRADMSKGRLTETAGTRFPPPPPTRDVFAHLPRPASLMKGRRSRRRPRARASRSRRQRRRCSRGCRGPRASRRDGCPAKPSSRRSTNPRGRRRSEGIGLPRVQVASQRARARGRREARSAGFNSERRLRASLRRFPLDALDMATMLTEEERAALAATPPALIQRAVWQALHGRTDGREGSGPAVPSRAAGVQEPAHFAARCRSRPRGAIGVASGAVGGPALAAASYLGAFLSCELASTWAPPLGQIGGDIDVTERQGPTEAPSGAGSGWNHQQWEGYYTPLNGQTVDGVANTPLGAENATAGLPTWFYNVDGLDLHYSFAGYVWSTPDGGGEALPARIWLFGDTSRPLSNHAWLPSCKKDPIAPYYFDTIGWSSGTTSDIDLGSYVINFYTLPSSGGSRRARAGAAQVFEYSLVLNGAPPPHNTRGNAKNDDKTETETLVIIPVGTIPTAAGARQLSLADMGPGEGVRAGISLRAFPSQVSEEARRHFPGGECKYVVISVLDPAPIPCQTSSTKPGRVTFLTYFDEDPDSPTFCRFPVLGLPLNTAANEKGTGPNFHDLCLRKVKDTSDDEWVLMWVSTDAGGMILAAIRSEELATTQSALVYYCGPASSTGWTQDVSQAMLLPGLSVDAHFTGFSVTTVGPFWVAIGCMEIDDKTDSLFFWWVAETPWGPQQQQTSTLFDNDWGRPSAPGTERPGFPAAGFIHAEGDDLTVPNFELKPGHGYFPFFVDGFPGRRGPLQYVHGLHRVERLALLEDLHTDALLRTVPDLTIRPQGAPTARRPPLRRAARLGHSSALQLAAGLRSWGCTVGVRRPQGGTFPEAIARAAYMKLLPISTLGASVVGPVWPAQLPLVGTSLAGASRRSRRPPMGRLAVTPPG